MSDVMIKREPKEFDSRSVKTEQKPARALPGLDEPMGASKEVVLHEGPLTDSYAEALAFAEEPVKILIHQSHESDKTGANCTDYIAVNGVPAEVLFKNGFVPIGYLPKGIALITKRKYVERMAMAKTDTIRTNVVERDNEDPQNFVERVTTSVLSFSVLEDKNPKGQDWLANLIRQRN